MNANQSTQSHAGRTLSDEELEQLDLYLDHELADADVRRLDEQLAGDPALAKALESMRAQRALRLAVMSTAFDTDAASVERLVASVRVAQANEAMQRRRWWAMSGPARSVFTAAACVAFGLLLGVTLQSRHNSAGGGVVASPAVLSTGSFTNAGYGATGLEGHGAYVVSVLGADGREFMKVRFYTQEQAQQFIDRINNRSPDSPSVRVGDAHILDEPY